MLLDRDLLLDWLDTAALLSNVDDVAAARKELSMSLSSSSLADTARSKTVTALTRSWISPADDARSLVQWARERAPEEDDRRALHVGVLLATQPFFADLLTESGIAMRPTGVMSTPDLRRRMKRIWGTCKKRRQRDAARGRRCGALGLFTGKPMESMSRVGEVLLATQRLPPG